MISSVRRFSAVSSLARRCRLAGCLNRTCWPFGRKSRSSLGRFVRRRVWELIEVVGSWDSYGLPSRNVRAERGATRTRLDPRDGTKTRAGYTYQQA